ncbi:membrane-bound ClpP family serine protease [Metabacillus crassostreae]|uniref:DUF4190 domain-containing protein n=1 Tax=Metabacillus crassostreae TaxID=929098 RepID=UPI00195E2495|nr:DUF4190 domain-containing protein [Metabacillus crassostreae]MBM7602471.1 membrane-bound ClpP family serine protease [Metabacillus crassostreae]
MKINYQNKSENPITNGKAIAAFILGVLSILAIAFSELGLFLGVTGLILGIIGLNEIKRFGQEGRKMAIAGIVCSCLSILITLFLIVASVLLFLSI